MNSERIAILIRLGLAKHCVEDITWFARLEADEADDVFSTLIGSLVWAD